MKIDIIMQFDNNKISWQKHTELYQNDQYRAFDMKCAFEKLGYKANIWSSFSSFYEKYIEYGLSSDLVYYGIESCFGRNRNSILTSFLEMNQIPYIGNDSFVNTITSDKLLFKDLLRYLNISTPRSVLVNDFPLDVTSILHIVPLPCVLKYRYGTMSYHTKIAKTKEELINNLNYMLLLDNGPVLCEEYITGQEITVPVVGCSPDEKIIAVIEYTDSKDQPLKIYDSHWKGELDKFVKLKPMDCSLKHCKDIMKIVHRVYSYLEFHDYARFDFRLSENLTPYLLEANSIPSLAYESAFDPKSYGGKVSFDYVLNYIVKSAISRLNLLGELI